MNPRTKLILTGVLAFVAGGTLFYFLARHQGKGEEGDESAGAAAVQVKHDAEGQTIVVLDAETQKRAGIVMTNIVATEWQPEVKGFGRVIDPLAFQETFMELQRTEALFDTSHQELERAKTLKADNNISERAFQETEGKYEDNFLAVATVYSRIENTWGRRIASMTGPIVVPVNEKRKRDDFFEKVPDSVALIRVDIPTAEHFENGLQSARIVPVTGHRPVKGYCFDLLPAIDPQTQMRGVILTADQSSTNRLVPGEAVTAFIKVPGFNPSPQPGDRDTRTGVVVPFDAVIRHEGKGWIYLGGADGFTRHAIPLEYAVENGWFVPEPLTNDIVVSGAQTLLSAELSSGGFNTGERD